MWYYILLFTPLLNIEKEKKKIITSDERNFYSILGSYISNKLTKTDPNTKNNLQNRRKVSRQSKEYKR
jgi:hypothetical protein